MATSHCYSWWRWWVWFTRSRSDQIVTFFWVSDSFDRHALELLERMLTLDPEFVCFPCVYIKLTQGLATTQCLLFWLCKVNGIIFHECQLGFVFSDIFVISFSIVWVLQRISAKDALDAEYFWTEPFPCQPNRFLSICFVSLPHPLVSSTAGSRSLSSALGIIFSPNNLNHRFDNKHQGRILWMLLVDSCRVWLECKILLQLTKVWSFTWVSNKEEAAAEAAATRGGCQAPKDYAPSTSTCPSSTNPTATYTCPPSSAWAEPTNSTQSRPNKSALWK